MTAARIKENIPQTKTGMIHRVCDISVEREPHIIKEKKEITENEPQFSAMSTDTHNNTAISEADVSNDVTTNDKSGEISSTIQPKTEPVKHKKKNTDSPSDDTNCVAVATYNQKPSTAEGIALQEERDTVLTSTQSDCITQGNLAKGNNAAPNIAMEQINTTKAHEDSFPRGKNPAQSGSKATLNDTELREINNSSSQAVLGLHKEQGIAVTLETQTHITASKILVPEGKPSLMLRGMPESILGSRSQEKRAPLLAVVKPSSTRTLANNTEQQSVASPPPGTNVPPSEPLLILTSEAANEHPDTLNLSMTQNSNTIRNQPHSQVLNSSQTRLNTSSQSHPQSSSRHCTHTLTSTQDLSSNLTNTQIPKKTPRKGHQQSETPSFPDESLANKGNQGMVSVQRMSQSASETRLLRSRVTKTPDTNQPLSSRNPSTKVPVLEQSMKSPLTSNQRRNERKQESKSADDDFCFSDGEEESIPQVIGSQVDRIEMFLNEKLRLRKKRKTTDDGRTACEARVEKVNFESCLKFCFCLSIGGQFFDIVLLRYRFIAICILYC